MNEHVRKHYNTFREEGFRASTALDYALIEDKWEDLGNEGLVRLQIEPDESPDMSWVADLPKHDGDAIWRMVERDGTWGIIGEYKCPCCGEWTQADSCWGFIGEDWLHSGYDMDIKAETIKKVEEGRKCAAGC